MDCAGRAQRRRRFQECVVVVVAMVAMPVVLTGESGVAPRFPRVVHARPVGRGELLRRSAPLFHPASTARSTFP